VAAYYSLNCTNDCCQGQGNMREQRNASGAFGLCVSKERKSKFERLKSSQRHIQLR